MHSNVMLRFIVQALQDPPLCSSTDSSSFSTLMFIFKFAEIHALSGPLVRDETQSREDTEKKRKRNSSRENSLESLLEESVNFRHGFQTVTNGKG
jgi:hypothetical protein